MEQRTESCADIRFWKIRLGITAFTLGDEGVKVFFVHIEPFLSLTIVHTLFVLKLFDSADGRLMEVKPPHNVGNFLHSDVEPGLEMTKVTVTNKGRCPIDAITKPLQPMICIFEIHSLLLWLGLRGSGSKNQKNTEENYS